MTTHHSVMTSSLDIKYGHFSCDIDYNKRTDILREVISLIINQCDPRRPLCVRQPRSTSKRMSPIINQCDHRPQVDTKCPLAAAAQASEARLYIYIYIYPYY